jgi:uncharacterized membrane protein
MGFFDSLKEGAKKLADRVTGGYGKIEFSLDRQEVRPGEELPFTINVSATGELKAKRVLIHLRGEENTRVEIEVQEPDGTRRSDWRTFTNNREEELEVHGALEMKEGESKAITGSVKIPADCQPTYRGVLTQHEWVIEADVDVPMGRDLKEQKKIYVR